MFTSHKVEAIVVEDDALSNMALCANLEGMGITSIRSARNGIQALQLLKAHSDVDFIVLDIYMPDMDGIEIMKELHDRKFIGGIILNSGYEETLQSSAKLGRIYRLDVWAALLKPFSLDKLTHVLSANLKAPLL